MEKLSLLDAILIIQGIGTIAYILFLVVISYGLSRLKKEAASNGTPFVSVIVAARNEEKNIARCLDHLLQQSYTKDGYEIIVIDDHSEDATLRLCQEYERVNEHIHLYSLGDYDGVSPKKAALQMGIRAARGEIIFTTDADCRVQPDWIKLMVSHFDEHTGAVASWLIVEPNGRLMSRLEVLDSAALVLVGAAGFGLGHPFVANGANFGYRKQVYQELNGFDGVENYVSGDDDLFLHKIVKAKKWTCRFVNDQNASVYTSANESLGGFFAQRFRWASKGGIYPAWLVFLELLIYLYYATLAASLVGLFFSGFSNLFLAAPFLVKFTADLFFFKKNKSRIDVTFKTVHLFFAEWLQIVYILIVGVWGLLGSYTWKGRTYTRGKIKWSEK